MVARKPRKPRKPRNDFEHQEQALLISWAFLREGSVPELENLYAIPNGSDKSFGVAARMKAEGLKPGVPDLCLAVLRPLPECDAWWGSLYIEMKSPTGYPRPDQREWADRLEKRGMKVIRRCVKWEDAARHILEYLGIEVTRAKFPELFIS